jgi:hypothetical protein
VTARYLIRVAAADADRATFDADRGGAKLEEMSGIAVARLTCRNCGGPLHAREGRYILKYFLLDGSRRRPLKARSSRI